jgi:Domain of unknown function (DUF4132)
MAFTNEALEPWFRKMLEHNPNKYTPEPNLGYVKEFLTGQTATLSPLLHNWFNEKFSQLCPLLLDENTPAENKRLLVALFTEPMMVQQARYYVLNQILPWFNSPEQLSAYANRISLLHDLGWTDKDLGLIYKERIGRFLTLEMLLKNDNKVIQLINETYRNLPEAEINTMITRGSYSRFDEVNALLLYVHHREICFRYLQTFEKSDYSPYIDTSVLRFCLTYEPDKYKAYYYNKIQSMPAGTYKELGDQLGMWLLYDEFFPVQDEILQLAPKYLDMLIENKGSVNEGATYTKRSGITSEEGYSYLQYSGWSLYYLLQNDEALGLNYLDRLTESGFALTKNVLSMLYIKYKAAKLSPLILQYLQKSSEKYQEKDRISFLLEIFRTHKTDLDYSLFWQFNNYKSKNAKDAVLPFLAETDPDAESRAITQLEGKNAETRIAGARILAQLASPAALTALKESIETEKDDDARDIMLAVAGDEYLAGIHPDNLAGIIEKTKKRGKLKKAITPWLEETELPALYFTNGRQLTTDEMRFILYRMSRVKELVTEAEIKPVVQQIERGSSNAFALEIFKRYKEAGFEAKYKYLLGITTLFGNDDLISMLVKAIDEWIEGNRKAMAELGIQALALHSSNKALRWIEWYSRKYKSKKPNIGEAALLALENAAQEQGITIHELGDRIVPDFGFEGLFRHFQVNGEEYRAFIDSNFKIAFFNEDNKKIKTIPAAADASIKDEFKYISKEIRDIVKSQSSRLEYYLIIQRRWNHEQWKKFFLDNPVMFIYATKLVWGTYDTNEQLTGSFICNEDTSLLDENGDETELTGNELIGIVHPSQLNDVSLQAWKKQLFDLSVEQVFPQLDRRVPDMEGIDLSGTIIKKFDDIHMVTGSIRSTLERFGWFKGPTGDGGYLESFRLLYFEKKIEAVVELDGVGVGYGWGGDEKTSRLYFLDKTKVKGRHGYINSETDEKLVKLHDLPLIFLQETLAALESIKRVEKKAPTENN